MNKNRLVLRTSMVTLLYALVPNGSQAEITIVIPPGFENVEGNLGAPAATFGFRSQELKPASWFRDLLPEGGAWLVGIIDRADAGQQQNATVRYNDLKITASTTQRDTISTVFADNVGNDAVVVFNGPGTFTYQVGTNAPHPFSGMTEFTTPFFYNPDDGNLLLDIVSHSGADRSFTWDSTELGIALANGGGPNASSAGIVFTDVIVAGFMFVVPEPASAFMLLLGAPAFLGRYARRARTG